MTKRVRVSTSTLTEEETSLLKVTQFLLQFDEEINEKFAQASIPKSKKKNNTNIMDKIHNIQE